MDIKPAKPMKILVTGAGGAAAIAFFKAVSHLEGLEIHMADMQPFSSGLYLVDGERRCLLPPGEADNFSLELLRYCTSHGISVVVPTVDCELAPLAAHRKLFGAIGIRLVLSPHSTLLTCYDKYKLMEHLRDQVELVEYRLYDNDFDPDLMEYPFVLKPRVGAGSRGVRIIDSVGELNGLAADSSLMVQEYLPGAEYSVDVYVAESQRVIASVVRERIKVDSGIAVISKTIIDEEISDMASRIARFAGIRYVANIQFKRDRSGRPRLLEINPRFPGTMSLTVAAGVNMPEMCLREIRGARLPGGIAYQSIAMVRNWQETYLPVNEFMQTAA